MPLCSRNEIYKRTYFHTLLFIFWWTVSPLLISWSLFCSCFQSAIIMIPPFFPLYFISVNWIIYSGFSSTQTSLIKSSPSLNANQGNKEETSSSHIILQLLLFPPLRSQTSPKLLSLLISLAYSFLYHSILVFLLKIQWPPPKCLTSLYKDDHTLLSEIVFFLCLHAKTLFFLLITFYITFPIILSSTWSLTVRISERLFAWFF